MPELTQAARDAFRNRFLLECYRRFGTGIAPEAIGGLVAVGRTLAEESGIDPSAADEAYLYWSRRGYISPTMRGGGHLTTAGQDAAEELLRRIESGGKVAADRTSQPKPAATDAASRDLAQQAALRMIDSALAELSMLAPIFNTEQGKYRVDRWCERTTQRLRETVAPVEAMKFARTVKIAAGSHRGLSEVADECRVFLEALHKDIEMSPEMLMPASPGNVTPAREPSDTTSAADEPKLFDLFLSHASEDKATVADPLYERLAAAGCRVWYDKSVLTVGDSLRRKIDEGLRVSRFGVVILSPSFFAKNWPQHELDGFVARENAEGRKVILPVWHNVTKADVLRYSPPLADKVALNSRDGVESVAAAIAAALGVTTANQKVSPRRDYPTTEQVRDWIAAGDGPRVALEAFVPEAAALRRLISAFGNTAGGVVLMGVGKDGEIIGADFKAVDRAFHLALADTSQQPRIDLTAVVLDGKSVPVISVGKGTGVVRSPEGAFVRLGQLTQPLHPDTDGRSVDEPRPHRTLWSTGSKWLRQNKQWAFSGIGVAALVALYNGAAWLRDEVSRPRSPAAAGPATPKTAAPATPLPGASPSPSPTLRAIPAVSGGRAGRPAVIYDFLVEARLNCNAPEAGVADRSGVGSLPEAPYLEGEAGYEELRLLQPVRALKSGTTATLVNRFGMQETSPLRGSPTSFLLGFSELHLPIVMISPISHWQCLSMHSYEVTVFLNGQDFWSDRKFFGKRPWQGGGRFDVELDGLHARIKGSEP